MFDTVTLGERLPSTGVGVDVTLPLKLTLEVNVESGVTDAVLDASIDLEIDGDDDIDLDNKDVREMEVEVEDDADKLSSNIVRVGLSFERVASDDCVGEMDEEPDTLVVPDTQ